MNKNSGGAQKNQLRMEVKRYTLKPGTQLYSVVKRSDSRNVSMFLSSAGDALLWALMSIPELRPISVQLGGAESIANTFVGDLANEFRFPLQGDYVLYMTTVLQDTDYIAQVYPEDYFKVDSSNSTEVKYAAYFKLQTTSPLLSESFIVKDVPSGENKAEVIDFNATLEYLSILTQPDSQLNLPLIDEYVLRCPVTIQNETSMGGEVIQSLTGCNFGDSYRFNVNWEAVWKNFIEARDATDQAKYTPVQVRNGVKQYLTFMVNQDLSGKAKLAIDKIIIGRAPIDYEDCVDNIVGFYNETGTSCFMDSTLMAMFAFKGSPFYDNLVLKPIDQNQILELVCVGDDAEADFELRKLVQLTLTEDVKQIYSGAIHQCTFLRNLLGTACANGGQDLSQGNQDPRELYQRLLKVINYYPIRIQDRLFRATDELGTNSEITRDELISEDAFSFNINDPDLREISWPYSFVGMGAYDNKGYDSKLPREEQKIWAASQIRLVSADVIVVHIDRRPHPAIIPVALIQNPIIPNTANNSTNVQGPFATPQEVNSMLPPFNPLSAGVSSPFTTSPFANPFNTVTPLDQPASVFNASALNAYVDEETIDDRALKISQIFNVDGRDYTLKSVVYSVRRGHYGCILKCGSKWYGYDDSPASGTFERLYTHAISDNEAIRIISTRGILFFYYPPVATGTNQITMADLAAKHIPQNPPPAASNSDGNNNNNLTGNNNNNNNNNLTGNNNASEDLSSPAELSLQVVSFNVSYYTMENKLEGSEKPHVQQCQEKYPYLDQTTNQPVAQLAGWFDPTKLISTCSLNAASFLARYDLMGLQEVHEKYREDFFRMVGYFANETYQTEIQEGLIDPNDSMGLTSSKNVRPDFKLVTGFGGVAIGYNEAKTGPAILLTNEISLFPSDSEYARGIIIVYFQKIKLLLINIHAPHGNRLKMSLQEELDKKLKEIESKFSNIELMFRDKYGYPMEIHRIMMTGDFNDYKGTLTNQNFKLLGFTLRIPNNMSSTEGEVVPTCCTDTQHKFPGDYIFDSHNYALDREIYGQDYLDEHYYYGLPLGYIRDEPLMSDHDPISLRTLL